MTSTIPNATPTDELPAVTPLGGRIAADLRVLADLAERHPAVAVELARTVQQLYIVPRMSSPLRHHDVGDPLIECGAHRVPSPMREDPIKTTQTWRLPAGAIHLSVVRLDIPGAGLRARVELNAAAS